MKNAMEQIKQAAFEDELQKIALSKGKVYSALTSKMLGSMAIGAKKHPHLEKGLTETMAETMMPKAQRLLASKASINPKEGLAASSFTRWLSSAVEKGGHNLFNPAAAIKK